MAPPGFTLSCATAAAHAAANCYPVLNLHFKPEPRTLPAALPARPRQALLGNRTLRRLNMAHTCIGDPGAKALCEALQQNGVLRDLNLADTPIDRSWIKLINNIVSSKGSRGEWVKGEWVSGVGGGAGPGGRTSG